jgi:hypothetical protein
MTSILGNKTEDNKDNFEKQKKEVQEWIDKYKSKFWDFKFNKILMKKIHQISR